MVRYWKHIIWLWTSIFFAACASVSVEKPAPLLLENLTHPDVVQFPLKTTTHGRWIVSVDVGEGKMADMILDTGATYSAFFNQAVAKYDLTVDEANVTRIHGLVTNSFAANTTLERLGFGQDVFHNKSLAVLPKRESKTDDKDFFDGIIGMDIMKDYRIYVDVSQGKIYFIPNVLPNFTLPENMTALSLFSNPYVDIAPELHFLSLSLNNKVTPALLDTGTDVHIINWHAATFVQARAMRSQLKWQWKVAGAVGEFNPVVRAHIHKIKSNGYQWEDINFIIKKTDSLDIIGMSEEPIIIAGIGLFDNRNVYFDFKSDKLWLQKKYVPHKEGGVITICQSC